MQDMIATPGQAWRQMEEELRLIHDLIGGTATMRQALDSRWARQVGIRAIEICDMIAAG